MIASGRHALKMLAITALATFGPTALFAQIADAPATSSGQTGHPGMPPAPEISGLTVEPPGKSGPLPMQAPQPQGLVPATTGSQLSGPYPVPSRSTLQGPTAMPIPSDVTAPMPAR